jgi:glycosyltransferase involved in cell wall biosynthesis
MRLLQVVAELRPGGAERIVLELLADARRHGDTVAVASAGGPWVDRLDPAVTHFDVPLRQRSMITTLAAARPMRAVLRNFQPDVVHAHNLRATVAVAAALATLLGRPRLLTTLHGVAPPDYASAARLLRMAGGHVVACAPAVARSLQAAGFPTSGVEVIVNGAGLRPPAPSQVDALRARLGVGNRPLVVGIGRLAPQKSWTTLVEAMRRVDGADALVAGEGPMREALEEAAAAAGGRVRFVGAVDDVASLLELADCVVSTSTWEGLPLSLLEALSLGRPVVATAVDGVRDIVPPDAAVLVPPHDPEAVAAAIGRVLHDQRLANRLSLAARATASAWMPERMLASYRACYAAICAQDGTVRRRAPQSRAKNSPMDW